MLFSDLAFEFSPRFNAVAALRYAYIVPFLPSRNRCTPVLYLIIFNFAFRRSVKIPFADGLLFIVSMLTAAQPYFQLYKRLLEVESERNERKSFFVDLADKSVNFGFMHKSEIHRLIGKVNEKGFTLVPLRLYFKQSLIKLEIGLCRGKHTYDKKQTIRERDLDRSAKREIKNYKI